MEAAEGGADYVAFGAFFPTTTKEAPTRAEPELLTGWQETCWSPASPSAASPSPPRAGWRPRARTSWPSRPASGAIGDGPAAAVKAFNAEIALGVGDRAD